MHVLRYCVGLQSAIVEIQMMQQIKAIHCPKCSKQIGTLYVDAGKIYCHIGDVLARVLIHNCPVCQYSYHWHADEVERQAAKKKPLPVR